MQQPMTKYGFEKLSSELKNLKEIERPKNIIEIDTARQHGDLKENAEYHAARERQAFLNARIAELEQMVADSRVIDPATLSHNKVIFGSTILLSNLDDESQKEYTIVGVPESDPNRGLISCHSPLAKQLLGKVEGDEVSVQTPSGTNEFEILKIFYKEIKFE